MADNYLEKKMEEHRSGKAASSYRPKITPRGNRPGELIVDFTPCEVFVSDISHPAMADIVRELAGAGFKVSFTLDDPHRGTRLASTLGARYLPPSLPPDGNAIFLLTDDHGWELRRGSTGMRINMSGATDPPTDRAESTPPMIKTIAWGAAMLANLNDFQENLLKNIKIEGFSL